jgi:hypothetical protein
LSNKCDATNGTHIPLAETPNKRYIIATIDYYNQKRFHNIVLQVVCDTQKVVHDGGQFKTFSLYLDLRT